MCDKIFNYELNHNILQDKALIVSITHKSNLIVCDKLSL